VWGAGWGGGALGSTLYPLTFILSPRQGERRMFLGLSDSLLWDCWNPSELFDP